MEFIGAYWWLWLGVTLVFGAYTMYKQITRMRGMMNRGLSGDFQGAFGSLFSGIGPIVFTGAIAGDAGALLLLSVIINLIAHFK